MWHCCDSSCVKYTFIHFERKLVFEGSKWLMSNFYTVFGINTFLAVLCINFMIMFIVICKSWNKFVLRAHGILRNV